MDETPMRPANRDSGQSHPIVGMYDRPNRPAVSPLVLGLIVLLLVVAGLATYFLFLH